MATSPRVAPRAVRRPAASTQVAAPRALLQKRLIIEYLDITDIVPYEWNPRQNAEAVAAVAKSMELTQGFAMPVVVDRNNVLIAGHTRIEAAKSLGMLEAPVVRLDHLTPEQVNAFRVIDNKVAEAAKWDFDLLAGEIAKLDGMGLNFTDYGWSQEEIDCMGQLVAEDCLSTTELTPVADAAAATASAASASRAPRQARFVLGEIVFYMPIEQYRSWAEGVQQLCEFNNDAIAAEMQRRLGLTR